MPSSTSKSQSVSAMNRHIAVLTESIAYQKFLLSLLSLYKLMFQSNAFITQALVFFFQANH